MVADWIVEAEEGRSCVEALKLSRREKSSLQRWSVHCLAAKKFIAIENILEFHQDRIQV